MKYKGTAYLILIVALLIVLAAGCSQDQAPGTGSADGQVIQTYGEAELTARPDLTRISLEIETRGDTAESAVEENARLAEAVRSALFQLGLDETEVKTGSYRLFSYREQEPRHIGPDKLELDVSEEKMIFQAYNEILISTEQLDLTGELIDTAVQAGANRVNYISFELKDPGPLKMEALQAATMQARNKAEAIAEGAGENIARLVSIREERAGYSPMRVEYDLAAAYGAGEIQTPIDPGDVKVTATVIAEYAF